MTKPFRFFAPLIERQTDKVIWILIGLYVSFFSLVSWLKYNSFSYGDFDLAVHAQTVWNILHGSIYTSILGISFLGNHLNLILFLIAPVYAVFKHPFTLLFFQASALGLAAYPLYRLAKEELSRLLGVTLAFIYLLYPALGYANLFEFHPPVFATSFLLFMFYYFKKGRFGKFSLFMLLALFCQENISLIIMMFGIYAIFAKRQPRWVIMPTAVGAIWFWVSVGKIMPYFNRETVQFVTIYAHLGDNIFEIFKTILLHPLKVLQLMFTKTNIIYLTQLFAPLGLAPLLSPGTLLPILPAFLQHLLSSRSTEHTIYYHYTAEMVPFIFISTVYGIKRLIKFKSLKNNQGLLIGVLLIICLASNIYLGPHLNIITNLSAFRKDYLDSQKECFINSLPKDAKVVATFEFLPKLAHRKELYSFHHVVMGSYTLSKKQYLLPASAEYALIDFNDFLTFYCFYIPGKGDRNIRNFLKEGKWGILDSFETLVLFKRNYKSPYRLCNILGTEPAISNRLQVRIDENLQLLGYDIKEIKNGKNRQLHLIFYWKCLTPTEKSYGAFIDLTDKTGKVVHRVLQPFGYRIYPASSLSKGQIMKEDYRLFISSKLPKGNYQLKMGLFNSQENKMAKVSSATDTTLDALGRINLAIVNKD